MRVELPVMIQVQQEKEYEYWIAKTTYGYDKNYCNKPVSRNFAHRLMVYVPKLQFTWFESGDFRYDVNPSDVPQCYNHDTWVWLYGHSVSCTPAPSPPPPNADPRGVSLTNAMYETEKERIKQIYEEENATLQQLWKEILTTLLPERTLEYQHFIVREHLSEEMSKDCDPSIFPYGGAYTPCVLCRTIHRPRVAIVPVDLPAWMVPFYSTPLTHRPGGSDGTPRFSEP